MRKTKLLNSLDPARQLLNMLGRVPGSERHWSSDCETELRYAPRKAHESTSCALEVFRWEA